MKLLAILLLAFPLMATAAKVEKPEAAEAVFKIAKKSHVYISDMEQYGVEEFWTASLKGDCEDFSLWVRKFIGGTLLYVRTKEGEAHVVLKVGDKIVDNMADEVYNVKEMTHSVVYALNEVHVQNYLANRRAPEQLRSTASK